MYKLYVTATHNLPKRRRNIKIKNEHEEISSSETGLLLINTVRTNNAFHKQKHSQYK